MSKVNNEISKVTSVSTEIREDPVYGPVAIIDGQEYPIISEAPTLEIVQPAKVAKDAKYKGHIGDMLLHITDDYEVFSSKRLLIHIGNVGQGFELYSKFGEGETHLLCCSRNGVTPYVKDGVPVSEVCGEYRNGYLVATCPKATWDRKTGNKPECKQYFIEGFLDITDPKTPIPVQLRIQSTSLGAWNKYKKSQKGQLSAIQLRNATKKEDEAKENPQDFIIALTIDNMGTYVVPVFTLEKVDGASKFAPLCKYYRDTLFVPRQQPTTVPVEKIETKAETPVETQSAANTAQVPEAGFEALDDLPF